MFLLDIPTTDDLINYGVVLLVVAGIIGFLFYKRQKRKKEEEDHNNHHQAFSSSHSNSSPSVTSEDEDDDSETPDPIADVAEALDIPAWQVKLILGIPINGRCQATTAEDAEDAYNDADGGSDEEYLTIVKWIELEEDFDQMDEIEEIVENTLLHPVFQSRYDLLSSKLAVDSFSKKELCDNFCNTLSGSDTEKRIVEKLFAMYKG